MKPYYDNGLVRLYQADARDLPLPDGTVHCCVTSPPYFGLRVYKTEDDRVLGLESSMDQYITNLVDVFREVRRVLRDDGVLWVNMGDSYGGSGGYYPNAPSNQSGSLQGSRLGESGQLMGVPWRWVLALQQDGWILRDSIIWAKKSPMPESLQGWRWEKCQKRTWVDPEKGDKFRNGKGYEDHLNEPGFNPELRRDRQNGRDFGTPTVETCPGCAKCEDNDGLVLRKGSWRCTSSYEHIFMLVKGMGYWADGEAVRSQGNPDTGWAQSHVDRKSPNGQGNGELEAKYRFSNQMNGANRRNVWRDIHAEPYPGEHYATFPPDLPRLCIQASTSEQGCCPKCGAQATRVVERESGPPVSFKNSNFTEGKTGVNGLGRVSENERMGEASTLGWRPSCGHQEAIDSPEPCLVLDPFMGVGTTALAAMRLNRRCVGTDLSEEYIKQALARLSEQTLPMPLT